MDIFTVRLKNHPTIFVGKTNSSYAVKSDAQIAETLKYWSGQGKPRTTDDVLLLDAQWFVAERRAKVWTEASMLKRFLSYCCKTEDDPNPSLSQYEILMNGEVVDLKDL